MFEHNIAVAAKMLVQDQAVLRASQEPGEPMLAMLDWGPSQILAVDLSSRSKAQRIAPARLR